MDDWNTIQQYYDEGVLAEWERLETHQIEFSLTKRFLQRYIKAGTRVLDMGGGPGRYSLFLAEQGCDVTLADLSPANIDFALEKAKEQGLSLRAFRTDARFPTIPETEAFDHVLLMRPLYHLTEQADRVRAVRESVKLLKPGGILFCAFISSCAGVLPSFMTQFPLEKLHFLACEGFPPPCEPKPSAPPPDTDGQEGLVSLAEHYLYIGRKLP